MSQSSIPTKAELLQLIEDRARDPAVLALAPRPTWDLDRENPKEKHIRERERKITRMTNRLDKARRGFEQDFDLST